MKHAPNIRKTVAAVSAPKAKKHLSSGSAKTAKSAAKKLPVVVGQSKSRKSKTAALPVKSKNVKSVPRVAEKKVKSAVKKASSVLVAAPKKAGQKISETKGKAASAVKFRTASTVKRAKSDASKTIRPVKKSVKSDRATALVKKAKNAKVGAIILAATKPKTASAKKAASIFAVGKKIIVAPVKAQKISSPKKIEAVKDKAAKNKAVKNKAVVSVKKIALLKRQAVAAAKNIKKIKPKISAAKKKTAKILSSISPKENKPERRKIKSTTSPKTPKTKTVVKPKSEMQQPKILAAVKVRRQNINALLKQMRANANKIKPQSVKDKSGKRAEVENKIETVEAPVAPAKPKKRKAKAIGAAVFRGRRERYDFQVFPLDSEFSQMAAVSGIYVISKRKTDRNKRAHHALVCIGQTDSISGEIKRHQKKCIKKYEANVISILPEESEKKRLKIEEDLKSAHATACSVG